MARKKPAKGSAAKTAGKPAKKRKSKPKPKPKLAPEVKPFDGFPIAMLHFLHELEANNNREWFNENKWRYEQHLREPALSYIAAMQKPLTGISPHFVAVPRKSGGSLMRIYRDTRFSKEKTPYKTNVGMHLRHEKGKDVHCPGFYIHIEPEQSFVGAGIWHPDTDTLTKIRRHIDNHSDRWQNICKARAFKSKFKREGDRLKRPPRGYDADHPLIEDLKLKDHIVMATVDTDDIFSRSFVKKTKSLLKTAAPYVAFICEAMRLKF